MPIISTYFDFLIFNSGKSIYVIKTKFIQYLYSVYFVNQPLHVSGIFIAHHQEVYYIYIYI